MRREDASLFFRLVSYRYLRGSTAITTNKAVKDWPGIFAGDKAMTAAESALPTGGQSPPKYCRAKRDRFSGRSTPEPLHRRRFSHYHEPRPCCSSGCPSAGSPTSFVFSAYCFTMCLR